MTQITTSQFINFCKEFGRSEFIRRPVDIRPGRQPLKNRELKKLLQWLDNHCVQPYYVTKESQTARAFEKDIVFYFMNEQDSMVFTLCYCEICK